MKKTRKLIIVIVVFLILFGSWFVFRLTTYELPPPRTYGEAAFRFAGALQENDALAYELSVMELWPEIDIWMTTHTANLCHEYPFEYFGGGGRSTQSGESLDDFTQCKLENGDIYYFDIYDIEVELINGEYLVTSWGEVEEKVKR